MYRFNNWEQNKFKCQIHEDVLYSFHSVQNKFQSLNRKFSSFKNVSGELKSSQLVWQTNFVPLAG